MDGFEINKILGAVLATCLFTLSLNIIAGGIFATHAPAKPGYEIAVPDAPAGGAQAAIPPAEPIANRLANANSKKGELAAKKCVACHTFEKGGANKVGPNLYGVVGGPRAHAQGFSYSAGMKQMGGTWDFEALDKYLTNPREQVKGTSMTFVGIRRPDERADVIAYLNSLSDSPKPLPKPEAGAKADAGAQKGAPAAKSEASAQKDAPAAKSDASAQKDTPAAKSDASAQKGAPAAQKK